MVKTITFGCGLLVSYCAVGLVVGCHAWLFDSTSSAETLLAIPVIAIVWPLWLVIQFVFTK